MVAKLDDNETIKKLRAQAKVAQAEQAKSDALFSSISEGVIATDEHGRIIRVNQVTLDILGVKKSQLLGKWFPEAIVAVRQDGSVIPHIERTITQVFLSGTSINDRGYYRRADGVIIPVQLSVAPVFLKGKPIGAIQIFRDISFDIQMEKVKTDFMSIASHQLRTPLSAINTYTHMLADGYAGELNPTQASFLAIILAAVTRMNNLISTLLNVTRIEAGSITVIPKPTHLAGLVEEIVLELAAEADEHQVTLEFTNKIQQAVSTDALLVKEIFSNLISNAIKYTPEGGTVTVALRIRGNNIVFSATDNGYGIPESAHPYIFTKFYRAENVVKREVGGTGLGLYLTKIVAENLNGEIWFKSRENKGTTFYFSLPKKGSIKKNGKFKLEA